MRRIANGLLDVKQRPNESVTVCFTRVQDLVLNLESVLEHQAQLHDKPVSFREGLLVPVAERGISPPLLGRIRLESQRITMQESFECAMKHE